MSTRTPEQEEALKSAVRAGYKIAGIPGSLFIGGIVYAAQQETNRRRKSESAPSEKEALARASEARSYAYMAQLRTEEAAHRAQLSYNRLATVAVAMAIGAPLLLGLIVVLTSII